MTYLTTAGELIPKRWRTSALVRMTDSSPTSHEVQKTTSGLMHRSKEQAADHRSFWVAAFFGSRGIARVTSISKRGNQNGGGFGCGGFGPKARAVSRCGRLTLERASCRAYSLSPSSLYCGLVSAARNA